MRDFTWSATGSLKPLHKVCDLDLMFDAHIRDGHLHKAEPLLDALHPFGILQDFFLTLAWVVSNLPATPHSSCTRTQ